MKRLGFILILFLTSLSLSAQIKFNATPTGKHGQYLKYLRTARKTMSKEQRKALKDSLKRLAGYDKLAQIKMDSVIKAAAQRHKLEEKLAGIKSIQQAKKIKEQAEKQGLNWYEMVQGASLDSSFTAQLKRMGGERLNQLEQYRQGKEIWEKSKNQYLKAKLLKDSLQSIHGDSLSQYFTEAELKELEIPEQFDPYEQLTPEQKELLDQYKAYTDSLSLDSLKAMAVQQGSAYLEEELKNQLTDIGAFKELNALEQQNQALQEQINGYKDQMNPEQYTRYTESIPKPSKEEIFGQLKTNIPIPKDKLAAARNKLAKLKKKYSSIVNTDSMQTAVKRNSLEKEPFHKRLSYGGYFDIQSTDPFAMDFAPTVSYSINKKWQAGLSAMYRRTFGEQDSLSQIPLTSWGARVFTNYEVKKGFFGQLEYDRSFKKNNTEQLKSSSEGKKVRKWSGVSAINMGIGRRFKLTSKINSSVLLLYDVMHESGKSIQPRPISVRFGLEF